MIDRMKELDWPGLSNLSETRICSAFGIAPILIGLRSGLEHATYSNYVEAKRATYQSTLRPLWALLDRMHTKALLSDESPAGSRLEVYSDLTHIPALQEDEDRLSERAINQFKAGLIDLNEARALIGQTKATQTPQQEPRI
jgi:phage portal protein BeeE